MGGTPGEFTQVRLGRLPLPGEQSKPVGPGSSGIDGTGETDLSFHLAY